VEALFLHQSPPLRCSLLVARCIKSLLLLLNISRGDIERATQRPVFDAILVVHRSRPIITDTHLLAPLKHPLFTVHTTMRSGRTIIALGALAYEVQAVLVANNSPCAKDCGNFSDRTGDDEIVCEDGDYGTTSGKVFQSCVACESTSSYATTYGNHTVSDLQAMLCTFSN
jgi:hypothetical protein